MANAPQSQVDAVISAAPSYDFRTTVDTSRFTKAIYVVDSTNDAMNVYNEYTEGTIAMKVGGQFYPFRTKTAVTATGYTIVYCY